MAESKINDTPPKDSALFQKISEAVKVGLDHLQRLNASGRHFGSYHEWPSLSFLENGMPSLTKHTVDAPVDYKDAFNPLWETLLNLGKDTKGFDLTRTSAFEALLGYIESTPNLRAHFMGGNLDPANQNRRSFLTTGVSLWVQYLIDRYVHLHKEMTLSEGKLLAVYKPMEPSLIDDELPVHVCVPILFARFESDRIDLADRARIASLSSDFHLARADLRAFGPGVHQSVMAAATHALFLLGYKLPNRNYFDQEIASNPSAYPLQDIDAFFAALRIATSIDTGYAQLILTPIGWARSYRAHLPYLEGTSIRKYPYWFEDFYWTRPVPLISNQQVAKVAELFAKLRAAFDKPEGNKLLLATQRLNSCFLRENDEDTILDATIAMELLLSDDEGTEITHKLATRMAALSMLAADFAEDPVTVFRNVKQIYGFRSGVIHGNSSKAKKKREITIRETVRIPTVKVAIAYIRMALKVLLDHPEYLVVSAIDESLLCKRVGGLPSLDRPAR